MTLLLADDAAGAALVACLPATSTPDFRPQIEANEQFAGRLRLRSSQTVVTLGLIAVNCLIFIGMLLDGGDFFQPVARVSLAWGLNFDPFTTDGDWWRLFTYYRTVHWITQQAPGIDAIFNAALRADDHESHAALREILETKVIPFWQEASDHLAAVQLPKRSANIAKLDAFQNLSDRRAQAFQLLDEGLRENNSQKIATAGRELRNCKLHQTEAQRLRED